MTDTNYEGEEVVVVLEEEEEGGKGREVNGGG